MSRVSKREWYRRVNLTWPHHPDDSPIATPVLTIQEARRAARKLYRHVRGSAFRGLVLETSGNRYNDIRSGNIYVNPARGWKSLVHELSHSIIFAPHGGEHARLEMRMIKHVIKLGWLSGKLKDKVAKPVPDKRAQKYARTLAAIQRWSAKERRAANALKKLRRSARAQERALHGGIVSSEAATVH